MARTGQQSGRRLGDYEILEEIGRGGMGIVYKARQRSLGRVVALKVLPSFAGMDPDAVARFRREAEAAGRLAHPGIVPIYGVGEADGIHFYAMELVEGPSLASVLDRLADRLPERLLGSMVEEAGLADEFPQMREPPGQSHVGTRYARSCAALIAQVASALAVAHREKVIHRDLKPNNVLIHRVGRPVLVDFGLARDEMATGLTRTGDAVGTPAYMAPEQASGQRELDARVDVYGLGATLYEMLTLRPPFTGAHAGEIMRQIMVEDPVPVRRHNPRVPLDLETIVHRCLAKHPDERYPCIEALEIDLNAFLDGRGILARPPSGGRRLLRFWQRHRRAMLAAAGSLLVAGIAGITIGLVSLQRAGTEGRQLLANARTALVERADVGAARELYARAASVLGDATQVAAARSTHAGEMFDRWYADAGKRAVLQEFLATLTAAERAPLGERLRRLAGQGRLVLQGLRAEELATAAITIQAFRDGGLEPAIGLPADGVLDIGDYLVAVRVPGRAAVVQAIKIGRDAEVALAVRGRQAAEVPLGMAQILGERAAEDFAIATAELTLAEYRAFLGSIGDGAQRAEMTPLDWAAQSAEPGSRPVRGLSFHQARAAAAHARAHLPSRREYLRAANGGLDGLPYPWGSALERQRLAADPDQLSAPAPVGAHPDGATTTGVLDLLGNVAELLGAGPDGALLAAGGHYQSDPARLRLTDADALFEPIAAVTENRVYAGMRLARFLPQPDNPQLERAALERRGQFLDVPGASLVHDWFLADSGSIAYSITLGGIHESRGGGLVHSLRIPVETEGFRQVGEIVVTDGHGQRLTVGDVRAAANGELSEREAQLAVPGQPGARYRLAVKSWLEPALGLRGVGDAFVLQIPLTVVGDFPVMHRVALPSGCRIDSVEPPPTVDWFMQDAPSLVWEFVPDGGGIRTIPAVIRFRRDGALADSQPGWREVADVTRRFLEALTALDRTVLDKLLHPAYWQMPRTIGRTELLTAVREGWRHTFAAPRLLDVTAVGPVATVELAADWIARSAQGAEHRVADWPLRVQLRRDQGDWRVLRFLPAGRADSGAIRAGSYVHDRLKMRLEPPRSVRLQRTQDELAELQVRATPDPRAAPGSTGFVVLGRYASPGESDDQALAHLTSGVSLLGRGELLDSGGGSLGPPEAQVSGTRFDWMFAGEASRSWSRERWIFVRKGLRCFLVREIARGADREDAQVRFGRQEEWFGVLAARVRID